MLRPISPRPPSGVMRIEPLRYFGGAIRTSSCWGAVAWPLNEPALLVLRFADPRRRDAPPERDLRELFFFCCSCAILYWFSVSLFPSVSRKRRYLQPLARVRRGRSHPRPGRPFPESDDAVIRVHPERGRCRPVRAVPLLSCPLRPWPVDRRPGRCSAGAWPWRKDSP